MSENAEMIAEIAADMFGAVEEVDLADVGLLKVWPTLVELGWPLVGIAEERGGAGGSFADLAAVIASMGRHSAAVPLIEHSLASWAITAAGENCPTGLATATVEGAVTVAAGTDETRVSGRLPSVGWVEAAEQLVTPVTLPDETEVLAVLSTTAPGITRRDERNLGGEPRSDLTLESVPARLLRSGPSARELRLRGGLLSTIAMLGAMEAAYELTRVHVGTRQQFGRELAKFQVVSSALAEMSSELTLVRGSVDAAVQAYGTGSTAIELAVTSSRVLATMVTDTISHHAHHLHGAMGITREYPLHKATRRLWSWRDEWGSARQWRRELGTRSVEIGPNALWDEMTALCDAGLVTT
jgi:alkylation response protein AidB-like acyl-CoA dehydrogenase